MGFGVSGSYALLFIALLVSIGTLYGAVSNTSERVTDAMGEDQSQSHEMQRTDITITSANYRAGTLRLEIENAGDTTLSVSDTDLLVDGEYIVEGNRTSTVSGNGNTDLWVQGKTLELRVDMPPPDRVKTVTEHGIAAVTSVKVFSLTANVAFTNGSDALRSYGADNQFTDYPGTATAVGAPISNFAAENTKEIPSVNSSGDVIITTATDERTILASNAKTGSTRLSAGRWQSSDPSIFYVNNSKHIIRVNSSGETTPVSAKSNIKAQGVAGIGDIDDDSADELIYGGNGPGGISDSIAYVDDDGTLVGTEAGYGTNNGIGIGEPADFNGDGTVRVPYVDGSNDIYLVDGNGDTTKLTSNGPAIKAPIATGNFDGDDPLEIYFVGSGSNELEVLDNVTVDNTIKTVKDSSGNSTTADDDAGVA